MGLKVAAPLNPQQLLPHTFASPKPASSCQHKCTKKDRTVLCGFIVPSSCASMKLLKKGSLYKPFSRGQTIKRSCSMNFDDVFHEDLSEQADDLVQGLERPPQGREDYGKRGNNSFQASLLPSKLESLEPFMLGIEPESPEWPEREELMRATFERRANSIDLPLSLRMIKKKHQWQESFQTSGDSAYCPVQKAFSSMVSIILELQSYALKMREVISHEDLEGIIGRVHREMHVSFVWLFQQVFCRTPYLMIHVMVLLANFSTYSVAQSMSIQDPQLFGALCEVVETVSVTEGQNQQLFDEDVTKSYNTASTDYDNRSGGISYLGRSSDSIQHFVSSTPQDTSLLPPLNEDSTLSEEEMTLWNSMMDEATKVQAEAGGDVVNHEMMQSFVSPVSVEFEKDDYLEYFRTDLLYQMSLAQEPSNSLLLCNYARFLHLVVRDYDRAEECFKRAIHVDPMDAETLGQYANFLWVVRKDLWGAEERYLQALAAEPENPYHASTYANFLWSTGGEETCFPLDTSNGKC